MKNFDLEKFIETMKQNGLKDDAIEYLTEWYCNEELWALMNYAVTPGYGIKQMTDEEFEEFLEWFECDEEEFEDKYGGTFADASFDGYIVYGESVR